MKKVVLFWCMALSFISAMGTEILTDTLLVASTASSIEISSDKVSCSVIVNDIDGTGDQFRYESKTNSRKKSKSVFTRVSSCGVRNIVIVERASEVEIVYVDNAGARQRFNFVNPDPENMAISSYRGKESFLDMGVTLSRKGNTRWSIITGGLGVGWVTPVSTNMPMDVKMGKSIELTWTNVIAVSVAHGRHHASIGLGLDWRNIVTEGRKFYEKGDDGVITMLPYGEDARDLRSRIKIFSLQMPLLYGFNFGKRSRWGFELGPVLNFNTSASIKTSWREGSRDYSVKTRHIGQRPVTVDVLASIKYGCLGIYARYAPMNMMKKSAGMEFGCFSTGLMLFF